MSAQTEFVIKDSLHRIVRQVEFKTIMLLQSYKEKKAGSAPSATSGLTIPVIRGVERARQRGRLPVIEACHRGSPAILLI